MIEISLRCYLFLSFVLFANVITLVDIIVIRVSVTYYDNYISSCVNASSSLDASSSRILLESVSCLGLLNPSGFAIDWISGIMYFGSYGSQHATISVSKLDGAYRTTLDIDANVLKRPSSIAVHPVQG